MMKAPTRLRRFALYATLGCALVLSTCSPWPNALQRIFATEHLRVAMVESPTTCYNAATGPTGFECDLLTGLAKRFGVALELEFVDSAKDALELVATGKADLAAGGIPVDSAPNLPIRFGPPLQSVVLQLVYRAGAPEPVSFDKLSGETQVVAGTFAAKLLEKQGAVHSNLIWSETADLSQDDLLDAVAEDQLPYTIAPSDLIAIEQRYYPSLRVGFDVSDRQSVAWAMRSGTDNALFRAVQNYLTGLGGVELARVRDRYFGHVIDFDYQGVTRFAQDVQHLLPRYRSQFRDAAARYGIDWRLLASIGYQESHWDPEAVSPTGVRGLMMLTQDTATSLEVGDRENASQSILGGARYFALILKLLPPQIVEPDRTWIALAAYNQGMAHLEDARMLASKRGGDPNRWLDIRNCLPLLTRPQWFKQTHAGYARGREAVAFVGNVRNYFDILSWLGDGDEQGEKTAVSTNPTSETPKSEGARPRGLRADGSR